MKKLVIFITVFVSTLIAFAFVGLVASVLMSDSGDEPDGVDRLGFPFVFKEQSGPVALDYFSLNRLIADTVVAVSASAWVGFRCAKRSTMTLPHNSPDSILMPLEQPNTRGHSSPGV